MVLCTDSGGSANRNQAPDTVHQEALHRQTDCTVSRLRQHVPGQDVSEMRHGLDLDSGVVTAPAIQQVKPGGVQQVYLCAIYKYNQGGSYTRSSEAYCTNFSVVI